MSRRGRLAAGSAEEFPPLPLADYVAIAREVLTRAGVEFTDQQVTEMAEDTRRFVDAFPPLTQEQLDRVAVLLRPAVPHVDGGGTA